MLQMIQVQGFFQVKINIIQFPVGFRPNLNFYLR